MDEFKTLDELKIRIMPAIDVKINEIKANCFENITRETIWEYLKIKWKEEQDLTLYDMVSDILNLDNNVILDFSEGRIFND